MSIIRASWLHIQETLFPFLERNLKGPLTDKLRQLVCILEVLHIEDFVAPGWRQWLGRPRYDRGPMARAFVAQAVLNLPHREALIDLLQRDDVLRQICGWEHAGQVPSSSVFCRAFDEFTKQGLGDIVLKAMVKEHMADEVVHHVSRDSTAITVREKAAKKPKPPEKPKKPRGRPKKGELREPPDPTRLERQLGQTVEESLAELPRATDYGTKIDTNGHKHSWKGRKLHLDYADGAVPLNAVTTSASMHDSQAAIPMLRETGERVTSLYDLMDSAYDADEIIQVSSELFHVPIIDIHPRRTSAAPFDPAKAQRYKVRTTAERGNARLKDEFGCRNVRVRGPKVHTHLMFGVLALFADQMLKVFT